MLLAQGRWLLALPAQESTCSSILRAADKSSSMAASQWRLLRYLLVQSFNRTENFTISYSQVKFLNKKKIHILSNQSFPFSFSFSLEKHERENEDINLKTYEGTDAAGKFKLNEFALLVAAA